MNKSQNNKSFILHNNPPVFNIKDRPQTTGTKFSISQAHNAIRARKSPLSSS